MKKQTLIACFLPLAAFAAEGPAPQGVPQLNHVFVIMMENHGYAQVVGNPSLPFTNQLAGIANTANNYFAVAHPSLTNYLEVAGGSNFGVTNDNSPDWHNSSCATNLASGIVSLDDGTFPNICPIWGTGTEAPTPAIDFTNETTGPPGVLNIDGKQSIPAASNISGKTIADQLASIGRTWKSYQEDLPLAGADRINYSDGFFTNLTDFSVMMPAQTPALSSGSVVQLYASKHNPFVYFRSIQEGDEFGSDLTNVVPLEGSNGLYSDLRAGTVPDYSFIVPNQCNDQHGRDNGDATCASDPNDDGTLNGLNPALMQRGDVVLKRLVTAIKESPAWSQGKNSILILWDENDYSVAPIINQVLVIVDNNFGPHNVHSTMQYNHFSLLKSIEAGFGLPCLNHACDANVGVMTDLFAAN